MPSSRYACLVSRFETRMGSSGRLLKRLSGTGKSFRANTAPRKPTAAVAFWLQVGDLGHDGCQGFAELVGRHDVEQMRVEGLQQGLQLVHLHGEGELVANR
jgi:hypothetical protein